MVAAISLPVEIQFVQLGTLRKNVELLPLTVWKSDFFRVAPPTQRDTLDLPDPGDETGYSDEELATWLVAQENTIVFAIIDAPLRSGYYLRRLDGNRVVVSIYAVSQVVQTGHYSLQSFIFRNVYQILVAYAQNSGALPASASVKLAHSQIAGCVFDWNANVTDIVNSLDSPTLCRRCLPKIKGTPLEHRVDDFVDELRRIRKPGHLRHLNAVIDYINAHPARSVFFAASAGVLLNLIASVLFEMGKTGGWFAVFGVR